jgi:hypothetical protein
MPAKSSSTMDLLTRYLRCLMKEIEVSSQLETSRRSLKWTGRGSSRDTESRAECLNVGVGGGVVVGGVGL